MFKNRNRKPYHQVPYTRILNSRTTCQDHTMLEPQIRDPIPRPYHTPEYQIEQPTAYQDRSKVGISNSTTVYPDHIIPEPFFREPSTSINRNIDPRIPTIAGRNMSGFHRPGSGGGGEGGADIAQSFVRTGRWHHFSSFCEPHCCIYLKNENIYLIEL